MGERAMITEWTGCYQDSWKGVITPDSFSHPAKFSKALIERILDYMAEREWIKKGDMIGDPFGGVGTGGVIAAYRGYQWVGVELEKKFVELAEANFNKHVQKWLTLGSRRPLIIQGDSRRFNEIVSESIQVSRVVAVEIESIISSPPYADVDAVVTSPPFGTREDGGGIAQTGENRIGRSIRAIVTSPPYETISAGAGGLNHLPAKEGQQGGRKKGVSQSADQKYGETPGQIAHCEKASVDAVLSSPPYEDSVNSSRSSGIDWDKANRPERWRGSRKRKGCQAAASHEMTYGDSEGQIGQEKGETYWEAMAKVYAACLSSLKPSGVMGIVVKDFVKDKKRMPLCDDTMRLLLWLGFQEIERIHAMLTEERICEDMFEGKRTTKKERKSFFRRLHESRMPAGDPRRIDHEEVLFVRKP